MRVGFIGIGRMGSAIAGRVLDGRQRAHRLEPDSREGGGARRTRRPSGVVRRRGVRRRRGRADDARERRGAARGRARPRGHRRVARQRCDPRRDGNARGERRSHADGRARGCRPDPRRRAGPRTARRRRCGTAGHRRRRPRRGAPPLPAAVRGDRAPHVRGGRLVPSPRPRSSSRTTSRSAPRSRRWRRRSRSFAAYAVEPALFNEVLTEGLFAAPAYKVYGTIIVDEDYDRVGFTTELALKDVDLTLAAAGDAHVPLPSANVLRDRLLSAIAHGDGDRDWAVLAREQARMSGLEHG